MSSENQVDKTKDSLQCRGNIKAYIEINLIALIHGHKAGIEIIAIHQICIDYKLQQSLFKKDIGLK